MHNNWRRYVGLSLFVAAFATVSIVDRVVNGPRGEVYHRQLVHEFTLTQPPRGAVEIAKTDDYSPWRAHQCFVGAKYSVSLPALEIETFYDQQLKARGWHPLGDRPVYDWGRNLGGRTAEYCKGTLKASLQIAGPRAQYGWTYALNLSWGLGVPRCR